MRNIIILVQSETHFQTLAPLASLEKGAVYSGFSMLLALGQMTVAPSNGAAPITFISTPALLTSRIDGIIADILAETEDEQKAILARDLGETYQIRETNEKLINNLSRPHYRGLFNN